jgi:RNA polymerase sigma factor (sigma-70 family)
MDHVSGESDAQLLARARQQDDNALRELLKRHGHKARSAIHGKIPQKYQTVLELDDIMQVTYLEAFLHIARFDGHTPGEFVTWLRRISQNALVDALRGLDSLKRPDPMQRVGSPDSSDSPLDRLAESLTTASRHMARDEAMGMIEQSLTQLPETYATVVRECDLEGRSVSEVAADMGRSSGSVHMLRARAHAQLRTLMGPPSNYLTDTA